MRQVTINLRGESGVVLMYDGKSWEISATLKGGTSEAAAFLVRSGLTPGISPEDLITVLNNVRNMCAETVQEGTAVTF